MISLTLLGTLGALSLGLAHWWVQRHASDLVPSWWSVWLGMLWLGTGPLLLAGGKGGAAIWAAAMLCSGIVAWPVARAVDARRRQLVEDAGLGARERVARTRLRRATPEEYRRVLNPPPKTYDLDKLQDFVHETRKAMSRLVEEESNPGLPDEVSGA